ncbi:polysaccharide deacetylase family protein [candidate division KSB1 bacterium]|nr:polysaccharide deacetylase family protein [candidate division KSB1 bacterium]
MPISLMLNDFAQQMGRTLVTTLQVPVCFWGERSTPRIYLTFDDGPHPESTPALLNLLARQATPATFFLIGERVRQFPTLVRDMAAAGHRLENHSYHHLALWFWPRSQVRHSLQATNELIEDQIGRRPTLFRPPYGKFEWNTVQVAREMEMKVVLWSLMPHDYRHDLPARGLLKNMCRRLRPGTIMVLHDKMATLPKLLQTLPHLIETVRERGFTFNLLD